MGLPTVIDFEPENDFGGTNSQQSSRYRTFLSHVAPDPDDGIDGAIEALYAYAPSLQRGAGHPFNDSLFVDSFDAELAAAGINRDGHYLFRVHVAYALPSVVTLQNDEKVYAENPLDDPIGWRSSFRVEMVVADKDIDGHAILNSAGDYYDPPPMRKKVIWTHACTKNVSSVPSAITSYANAVNSDPCSIRGLSCGSETVQIVGIDIPDVQYRGGVPFVALTVAYEVDEDGFDLKLLSQGYREKGSSGKLYDIYIPPSQDAIDEANNADPPETPPTPQRTTVPCMLDEDGKYLANPTPSTVHFTEHEITPKMSFSGLPGVA